MKKILTLIAAVMMVIPLMAIGNNSGKTKDDAIDFTWDTPMYQDGGTKAVWYRVDLAPLYEQDSPVLNLYLTNVNSEGSAVVEMIATVAGQTETKTYTIGAKESKEWSANAATLVRMRQKEIYLTLTTSRRVQINAKVYEASDLNDLCKEATPLDWTNGFERGVGDVQWFKVDLTEAKKTSETRDVRIAITNKGTKTMRLYAGQSLDCPSSGVTTRVIEVAAGATIYDTVPNSMIKAVAGDELYVSIENTQRMALKASFLEPPVVPVPPIMDVTDPWEDLHVTDTIQNIPAGEHYYRISVAHMNSLSKYEPEFTFRNEGAATTNMTRKMVFALPAYSAQGDQLTLAPDEETIEVIKKNTLEGLTNAYVYIYIKNDAPFSLFGRFKHVREGKACKTNIDFDWVKGHEQAGKTTQWYAVDVKDAKARVKDIIVTVENIGEQSTSLNAKVAFSCPYIDLQEFTGSIAAKKTRSKKLGYATYAMMTDTIWIGLETTQPIKFRADTVDAPLQPVDDACLTATMFNWTDGGQQKADTAIWYKIDMRKVRNQQTYPTVVVTNMSETEPVTIYGKLSLECPDSLPDQTRKLQIPAGGIFEKQLSRNMFENIQNDSIYILVQATQPIKFEVRRQAVPAGTDCSSAIRFNWVSGIDQKANGNLWYVVDLSQAIKEKKDIEVTVKNKDTKNACEGSAWISYTCPDDAAPQTQKFKLAAGESKSVKFVNSTFSELASDSVFVRLICSADMRVTAKLIDPAPFDTIECAEIMTGINEFVWDSLYTQTVDTAWYMMTKTELQKLVGIDLAPKVYVNNLTRANNTVQAEVAFTCPIEQAMMGKKETLSPDQSLSKQIARTTIEQYLNKEVVYVRVIAKGAVSFMAAIEDPNTGNDCTTARPIHLVDTIDQAGNTVMWYRINIAELKNTCDLHGKSLKVHVGASTLGKTTVKVGVYEDCAGEDFFEGREERTMPAGKSATHNIPAYFLYGLADKDLYIRVETNRDIHFSTSISDYATAPEKDLKSIAKTAAPNVTYTLTPNEENWFAVCLPQIRNNYEFTDSAKIYIENPNNFDVKVTTTSTWMDTLIYAIPERTRSIAANRVVKKTLREVMSKLIDKANKRLDTRGGFSIDETEASYLDSLIRVFITEDSLTMYVMLKPTAPLKWGIQLDRTTGDICDEAIIFDWEHGNVHPANETFWYRVQLDSIKVPADKDLRIHIDNWGDPGAIANVTASLYFDCNEDPTKTESKSIAVADSIDADRDLIQTVGWPDLLIKYTADQPTWMWVELIDTLPRQIDRDTVDVLICNRETYTDTITGNTYEIIDVMQTWSDTVSWRDGVQMRDSITLFRVYPILAPDTIDADTIYAMGMEPRLEVAKNLSVDASSKQLTTWFKALSAASDTINDVDTVYWAKPVYDEYGDLDPNQEGKLDTITPYKEVGMDTLLLVVKGHCTDNVIQRYEIFFEIKPTTCTNDTVWATIPTISCDSFIWDRNGQKYDISGTYYTAIPKPAPYCGDSVYELQLIINHASPVAPDTVILCADSYVWNGKTYTASGDYDSLFVNVEGCDSLAKLHLVLNESYLTIEEVSACNEYTWHGTRYIKSGVYYDSLYTVAGCDSVFKLDLTLSYDQYIELPARAKYGNMIVLIDKHKIDSILDWEYTEEDVQWFKVGSETPICTGYYYATGKPITGSYYAVISQADASGCARVATTVIVNCDAVTNAPKLVPTLAKPAEQIRLENLDPDKATVVRVFTTEGRLLKQYDVTNQSTFLMPAQKESGFYMVEVLTEDNKLTLRYIVK
ncbi:MAG: hypothetical protein IJ920_03935 [Paludibacteraceae bacterium]|nr:hypothetical protein [Paludibacteraceae bacterium]